MKHLKNSLQISPWLMSVIFFLSVFTVAILIPMSDEAAISSACVTSSTPDNQDAYPLFELSPQQSLQDHDSVFLAKVLVPTKPCSLGYCAGLRVLSSLKGSQKGNLLVRVHIPGSGKESHCTPDKFNKKGSKWLVFGHKGTSPGGTSYLDIQHNGPSFVTAKVPNFAAMEKAYWNKVASINNAIESKVGHKTKTY